jgi:hypothetical protein
VWESGSQASYVVTPLGPLPPPQHLPDERTILPPGVIKPPREPSPPPSAGKGGKGSKGAKGGNKGAVADPEVESRLTEDIQRLGQEDYAQAWQVRKGLPTAYLTWERVQGQGFSLFAAGARPYSVDRTLFTSDEPVVLRSMLAGSARVGAFGHRGAGGAGAHAADGGHRGAGAEGPGGPGG